MGQKNKDVLSFGGSGKYLEGEKIKVHEEVSNDGADNGRRILDTDALYFLMHLLCFAYLCRITLKDSISWPARYLAFFVRSPQMIHHYSCCSFDRILEDIGYLPSCHFCSLVMTGLDILVLILVLADDCLGINFHNASDLSFQH